MRGLATARDGKDSGNPQKTPYQKLQKKRKHLWIKCGWEIWQFWKNFGEKSQNLGKKSQIFGEKSQNAGEKSQIFGKKSQNFGEKSQNFDKFGKNFPWVGIKNEYKIK